MSIIVVNLSYSDLKISTISEDDDDNDAANDKDDVTDDFLHKILNKNFKFSNNNLLSNSMQHISII